MRPLWPQAACGALGPAVLHVLDGACPQIRSGACPRGLPGNQLTAHQKKVLKYANKVTKNTLALMRRLADENIPHTVEQPIGSLMQKDPAFKSWASKSGAQRAIVDQCQFGRPYRKRTAFWGFPSGSLDGVARVCRGDEYRHGDEVDGPRRGLAYKQRFDRESNVRMQENQRPVRT